MTHRTTYSSKLLWPLLLVAMLGLAGCLGDSKPQAEDEAAMESDLAADSSTQAAAPAPVAEPDPVVEPEPVVCANCGTITAIEERSTAGSRKSKEALIGTAVGAVVGAMVAGSQFSGDEENVAQVVAGAAGAAAGNQIGKVVDQELYYAVTVEMDVGGTQTVTVPDATMLSIGQEVRVEGENIVVQ